MENNTISIKPTIKEMESKIEIMIGFSFRIEEANWNYLILNLGLEKSNFQCKGIFYQQSITESFESFLLLVSEISQVLVVMNDNDVIAFQILFL